MKTYNYIKLILVLSLFICSSCETLDLDKTDDPFNLKANQVTSEGLFNGIQEDFVRQIEGDSDGNSDDNWSNGGDGLSLYGGQLTRMYALNSSVANNYSTAFYPSDSDDEWINAYAGILINIRHMTPLAEKEGKTHHIGITQFIEAYTMSAMVDFYGNIPYSQAIQGATNFNPAPDSGASIYAACIVLLDKAIQNFESTPLVEPEYELFYNNDYNKWIKAANTLKMKLYIQTRLVDSDAISKFNAIVSTGDYISDSQDDLVFQWGGTNSSNPDNRHPKYGLNYTGTGASDYLSNWFMGTMNNMNDPRIRYYFYRQVDAVPGQEIPADEATLPCSLKTAPPHYIAGGYSFCNLPNGYWGRDHGDTEGITADGFLKTTFGVYPAGGKFDGDNFTGVANGEGGKGKGITPILLASWVDFMKAEVALVQNNPDLAKTEMINGINKSISKVLSFGAIDPKFDSNYAPSTTEINDYIDLISTSWDSGTITDQWNIFAVQYFISVYGNGIESYNFYRRTEYPTTLQPMLSPNPGGFVRSMYYPTNAVNSNSNIKQKPNQNVSVFWNTNSTPIAN